MLSDINNKNPTPASRGSNRCFRSFQLYVGARKPFFATPPSNNRNLWEKILRAVKNLANCWDMRFNGAGLLPFIEYLWPIEHTRHNFFRIFSWRLLFLLISKVYQAGVRTVVHRPYNISVHQIWRSGMNQECMKKQKDNGELGFRRLKTWIFTYSTVDVHHVRV